MIRVICSLLFII